MEDILYVLPDSQLPIVLGRLTISPYGPQSANSHYLDNMCAMLDSVCVMLKQRGLFSG